jgi:two-component sensor histidine kinase
VRTGGQFVTLNQAGPQSLVVSALLTNAVKHAFVGDRRGTVTLGFACKDGQLPVKVSDDDVGVPPGFDPSTSIGMGLTIDQALMQQLGARPQVVPQEHGMELLIAIALEVQGADGA